MKYGVFHLLIMDKKLGEAEDEYNFSGTLNIPKLAKKFGCMQTGYGLV